MNKSLQFLYQDYEMLKEFNTQRKKEIEELIAMFQERVEAEQIYSERLFKIATQQNSATPKSIQIGRLADEIACYR